jgi:type II secretory pathway component GspD/PulD (secretin)
MKTTINKRKKNFLASALPGLIAALVICNSPVPVLAQVVTRNITLPPGVSIGAPPTGSDNSPSSPRPDAAGNSGPWIPSQPLTSTNQDGSTNDMIQLSFQGANIDMVVQWLSQTTGKSVLKHPQVQCQLTITSSRKVSTREAVNLVYRALALEGFSAIEFTDSILIVPQDKEPRMSAELLGSSQTNVPEGRQRLVKVFSNSNIQGGGRERPDRLGAFRQGHGFLDEQANQIIITDYNDNIRAVGELIAALDADKPNDVTIRVIALKNVSAADLMKELGPLYQKQNGKSANDTVQVTADEQSNTLLILSSETNFKTIQEFVTSLDTEEAQDKIMRTFTLKNADAQDVAKQLQDLNQDQNTTARYVFNYATPASDKSSKKMTVVADRRRNAVIIQAPPAQMPSLAKMIDELDAPVNDGSLAPKIYPLKYVSAADIEDVLNELFLKKQQQRSYLDYFYGDDNSDNSTADQDVGRLYGKVRITSEPYSNALIVTANSTENLAAVEDIINQLDKPSEAGESTLHIGLEICQGQRLGQQHQHPVCQERFAALACPTAQQNAAEPKRFPGSAAAAAQQQGTSAQTGFDLGTETKVDGYFPWLGGQPDNPTGRPPPITVQPVSDLVGRVRAVADDRSNALLISANVHFFPASFKID